MKKIMLLITSLVLAFSLFSAAPAQAVYPTVEDKELFTYGSGDNIATWLRFTHRKQDDGDGTAIEGYGVNTVAYCAALGNPEYVKVQITVKDWETGAVLYNRNDGADYACNSFHDLEVGSSQLGDKGYVGVTINAVACNPTGNDQLLGATWKVGGAVATLGHRSRSTWNVC